ncbi:hypothetical protein [Candidatus Borrarchaeum sp.]|uniref:hypothetical protein n=1 Tax=Candidatus Borrarchaeum sp. TaxID=2846742 RepID=UPI002579BEDE|nr:hypothetical protein [Candidatus Borrarchaeum sp.]
MRVYLAKRSIRSKFLIVLFILLFLTVITSLFVSNAIAIEAQSDSDMLTFNSLGINTRVFSSENGNECEETIEFNVDIDDNSHNRYSLHLNYLAGGSRPSSDFDIAVTVNDDHVVKSSIFRFIERGTKQWRHIEIPYEYMKDGTNAITITISFKSLSTAISTFTLFGESYFEITGINVIKSTGDYSLNDLVVLPSNNYEDKIVGTGAIGGFYSCKFEPQVEFFLQRNLTSVNTQLDVMFHKDVPSDCEVTYNVYVNDKALYEEEKIFEEGKIQVTPTTLNAGRNSIRFQILINSYRVAGNGGETPYTFVLKIGDNSKISFSNSNFNNEGNSEISTVDIPNILSFSLVVALLIFVPSFLFFTLKYKRSFAKETKVQVLSYVDANDSGKIKTLRIREETS